MNEQAGLASALSVLIVGAFAILLHGRDQPSPPPRPSPTSAPRVAPKPREPEPPTPIPTPSPVTRLETSLVTPAPQARAPETQAPRSGLSGSTGGRDRAGLAVQGEGSIARNGPAPNRPARPSMPRGDFTVVEPGETLANVAERVYGSGLAAESLWKANRDQLASLESPLPKGTLLRTP